MNAALRTHGLRRSAATGGLFADGLFQEESGAAVLSLPVDGPVRALDPLAFVVPEAELLVAVHHGSPDEADRTYAAVGSYAARHDLGSDGPAREYYLVGPEHTSDVTQWQTEICWPIITP